MAEVTVRRGSRWFVTGAAVTVAVAALLCIGFFTVVHAVLGHDAAAAAHGRAQAEQTAMAQARGFADAVVMHSTDSAGPPDQILDQLRPHGLRIQTTTRRPDLMLLVASSAPYAEMYGGGSVNRCFGIGFHRLGAIGAGYDLVERTCPG